MLLAVQADGASIRTVEGLAAGDELSALQQAFGDHHALQCGYCTPGMLVAATTLLERNPQPSDDEIRKAPAGQHLPLHRLLEHRRRGPRRVGPGGGGMTETVVAPERVEAEAPAEPKPWQGQSIPRKEDRRLVQGQGVFVDDIKRHNMGFAHYVRSPYAHAVIRSIDVSKALELPGVIGTLTGDEVATLTDPFFQLVDAARIGDQGLRAGRRPRALRRRPRGDRRGRDARARARRGRARRGRLRAARRRRRRPARARRGAAVLHPEVGIEPRLGGRLRVGRAGRTPSRRPTAS